MVETVARATRVAAQPDERQRQYPGKGRAARRVAEFRYSDGHPLVAVARQETGAVLTALTELELRGLVRQVPGMVFALA